MIRFTVEAMQFILLSSVSEIRRFQVDSTERIVSTSIAAGMILFCIGVIIFSLYLVFRKFPGLERNSYKFSEFFTGLKLSKRSKFFITYQMTRKIIYVFVVIWSDCLFSIITVIVIILIFELINTFIIVKVKPYKNNSDNLVELVNQMFFITYTASQFYLNSEEVWDELKSSIFIYVLMANNFIVSIIMISKFLNFIL